MRSEAVLTAAHWVSTAVVVLVLFLMAYILLLRAYLIFKEKRNRKFSALWTPILLRGAEQNRDRLPRVGYRDRTSFLLLWNTLRDRNSSDAELGRWMNSVAYATGIDLVVRRLLNRRGIRKKLLAVVTLGQLHDRSQWEKLAQQVLSEHSLLSLAATQAIVRIDPPAALPIIIPQVISRIDWPVAKVATILEEIGPDLLSQPLTQAVSRTTPETMHRAIQYLETCHPAVVLPAVRLILENNPDDRVIAPCLSVIAKFRDTKDLDLVRHFLTHARWHVRAHAAVSLGRIGTDQDEKKLIALLNDPEWWVRYRAAQALVDLSSSSLPHVHKLREKLSDRYARDILDQVMAERRMN